MKVINRTPFSFGPLMGRVHYPDHTVTIVIKAGFRLVADGVCEPLPEQPPFEGDVMSKGDNPECLYDADLVPFKPHADMLFSGACHSPGGKPVTTCPVEFRVGQRAKALACIGNRRWNKGLVFSKMSEIEPFTTVPITWANAFGGPNFVANPAGKGHKDGLLPNVEDPANLVRSTGNKPAPAGFGPISRTWRQRNRKQGSYDKKWLAERFPAFPADFDWSYFNAAPEDQQLKGYLRGDEEVELTNLHRQHARLKTRLPGIRVRVLVRENTGTEETQADATTTLRMREVPMHLDTLAVDGEKSELYLMWRGVAKVSDEDWLECRDILVVSEGIDEDSPPEKLIPLFNEEPDDLDAEATEAEPTLEESREEVDKLIAQAEKMETEYSAKVVNAMKAEAKGQYDFDKLIAAGAAGNPEAAIVKLLATLSPEEAATLKAIKGAHFNPAADPHIKEIMDAEKAVKPPKAGGKQLAAMMRSGEAKGGDFADEDLKGQNLAGADLSDCYLNNADLSGANLSGARLTDAILPGANLSQADLSGADLSGADLTGANLADANLQGATLTETVFNAAAAANANFSGVKARAVSCVGLQGTAANFGGADLTEAIFSEATLEGADFSGAMLPDAAFDGVAASGTNFEGADLTNFRGGEKSVFREANFGKVKACGSIWENSALQGADFAGADLRDAQFPFSDLTGARFFGADLSGGNLRKSKLASVQAGNANFLRARLEKADLSGASFVASNFYEAEFLDAEIADADFNGANLQMTKLAKK